MQSEEHGGSVGGDLQAYWAVKRRLWLIAAYLPWQGFRVYFGQVRGLCWILRAWVPLRGWDLVMGYGRGRNVYPLRRTYPSPWAKLPVHIPCCAFVHTFDSFRVARILERFVVCGCPFERSVLPACLFACPSQRALWTGREQERVKKVVPPLSPLFASRIAICVVGRHLFCFVHTIYYFFV